MNDYLDALQIGFDYFRWIFDHLVMMLMLAIGFFTPIFVVFAIAGICWGFIMWIFAPKPARPTKLDREIEKEKKNG